MDFKTLQEKYQNFYAPTFLIEVNGADLLKEKVEIFSVTVNNTLEGAADFSFTVNNPRNPDGKDFRFLKKGALLEVGKNITIKFGYGDRSGLVPLLVGLITAVDVSFPANGVSQLTVKGFDLSHKMMKKQHSKAWGSDRPITYSTIVNELAGREYKFNTANVVNTQEEHRHLKQDRESDYDFIKKKLAEKIDFEVFVRGNDFYFRPPADDKNAAVTTLEWGRSLISFSPEINTANQVSGVEVRGWDSRRQQAFVGRSRRGNERSREGNRQGGSERVGDDDIRHMWRPVSSQREADDLARSAFNRLAEGFVKGNGECIGLPDLLPGMNIELAGLGKQFSKVYYVEKTTHTISSSGYKTTFGVKETTI